MYKLCWFPTAFTMLALLAMLNACKVPVKKDVTNEKTTEPSIASFDQHQLIRSQHLNEGDNVHCGLQDTAGNIWFGTTGDGLYRYDAETFLQYNKTNGLKSSTIWCLLEDSIGMMWIGTANGVYQYEGSEFIKIPVAPSKDTISSDYEVWSIMQDKSGKLWFATSLGLYVYDGKSFAWFDMGPSVTDDCKFNVERILEDRAGNFWLGGRCNPGVYRYDGNTMTHHKPNGDDWAWPVLQDKNGDIWFSSWKGAYRYDGTSFRTYTKNDGLPGDMIAMIMEDKNGNLWFGGDGLSRYDGESFTHFLPKDGLTNTSVWTILEDNTGNFWVGTRTTGLYRYDGVRFTKFSE